MNNSKNGACLLPFSFILYFGAWIGTGILSWNWIEPNGFWEAVLFLMVWGVLGYIGKFIGGIIIGIIVDNMDR